MVFSNVSCVDVVSIYAPLAKDKIDLFPNIIFDLVSFGGNEAHLS